MLDYWVESPDTPRPQRPNSELELEGAPELCVLVRFRVLVRLRVHACVRA